MKNVLEKIAEAQTTEELWNILNSNMEEWGVPYLATWVGETLPEAVLETNRPDWWQQYYFDQAYHKDDPAVQHCLYNKGFFFYSTAKDQPAHLRPEGAKILSEVRDLLGFQSGMVFPVFSEEKRLGGMSISFKSPLEDLQNMPIKNFNNMLQACSFAFERFIELHQVQKIQDGGLASRERDCLGWLASGLRTTEIAQKLRLSDSTVTFHLNNAKRKLSSTTREQAVARAIMLGIIDPS